MLHKYNLSAIIIKAVHEKSGVTPSVQILGKSMLDWVKLSLPNCPFEIALEDKKVELPVMVRPYINVESAYTAVLYSDTPLLTKKTILDALATIESSDANMIKLTRGYIFKTAYLRAIDTFMATDSYFFDEEDFISATNFKQVSIISDILKQRILSYHMERGVHIEDISSVFIGPDVRIARGVVIGPNNILKGETIIKTDVKLNAGNYLEDAIVEQSATITASQIYKSFIGGNTTVGPYAYIRPDTIIGSDCRIGNYVEIKASIIGDGCKISHLSYVGDCEMGDGCNIGCGVVFVNYDGKNKHKAKVGKNVFVGSNANIIAPIVISDGAFVAAGSTIQRDVEPGALAVARARQFNKQNWGNNKYTEGLE
ncbi:MAG: hypothetical protein FWE13_02230 [Firmicutes bacterium]|nr:hypothetical protein [Bacillota bacterium]